MADFVMPSLGADMEAGVLVGWLKQPGESVRRGDIIAEVETDKGIIEVEVFTAGTIEEVLVQPGAKVPVGTVLARIREDGAAVSGERPTDAKVPPTAATAPPETAAKAPPAGAPAHIPMSPSARRLARELHVDPSAILGTGPGGAITRDDILAAAGAQPIAPTPAAVPSRPETVEPAERLQRMRQSIAAAMSRSKREIPHYYLATTIDLHRARQWLSDTNESRPVAERIVMGALLLKATAKALREVPELNAIWDADRVVLREEVHIGVAVSLRQGGLVVPALHNTDQLTLPDLMRNLSDLTERARSGRLRSSELSDATITVTSMGDRGVETVYGIIYPPQVAIVGFGKVMERPWSIDGGVFSRPVVTVTLAADHRVSDGHRGGVFLGIIERLLQEPETL
jgi:pyruvate dehydrogenase E2 component (dihydrolipoamide acetyltransferase)